MLTGGALDDTFVYLDLRDTNDTILDWRNGNDTIDLTALDANSNLANNQAFVWGGSTATANGLWFVLDTSDLDGTDTILYGDTDGDVSTAEFAITLENFSSFGLTPPPDILL